MSKKSRKKEKSAQASPEAEVAAAADQDLITPPVGEETAEALLTPADAEVMEELEISIDLEGSLEDSKLPEAVTAEALSGGVEEGEVPRLSHIIEAILFASQKAVTPKELAANLKSAAAADPTGVASAFARIKESNLHDALLELQAEVAASGRAYQVREMSTGWLLSSAPGFAPWLRALYPEAKPTRLSPSALETLAIIAYRQPIARADMEAVRGVSVDGVMQTLLDRGLVKISGRAEVAGRPLLYATTQYFLDHFGLRHLDELPNAAELRHVQLPKATPEPEESTANNETGSELGVTSESVESLSEASHLNEEASDELEEVEITDMMKLRESVVFAEVAFDTDPDPDPEQEDPAATSESEGHAAAEEVETIGQADSSEEDSGRTHS
ncbi:MAG: SMC-Scp complex subunit ScpB [Chthoniobacterales bacterium]